MSVRLSVDVEKKLADQPPSEERGGYWLAKVFSTSTERRLWVKNTKKSDRGGLNTKKIRRGGAPPRRSDEKDFFCIQTDEVGFFLYSHEKERELIITSVIFMLRHMYSFYLTFFSLHVFASSSTGSNFFSLRTYVLSWYSLRRATIFWYVRMYQLGSRTERLQILYITYVLV